MAGLPTAHLTFEEYLRQEQSSEVLHEYHDGEVFEVEAASPNHEQICAQTAAALLRAFPSCRVFGSKLCLYLEAQNRGVYPDVTVICGNAETIKVDGLGFAILNPTLLV